METIANKDYLNTTKKQKIKDTQKKVEEIMNKKNYMVLLFSMKGQEVESWSTIKDIPSNVLPEILEQYLKNLKGQYGN